MADKEIIHKTYQRNFLTKVIAKVDLVSPIAILNNEIPKELSKSALKNFPIDEPKPSFRQELLMSAKELSTRKQDFTEWNFYSRNRGKRITINPDSFFAAYSVYESYEILQNDFLSFADTFFTVFEDSQPSRLGLRYINEIKLPGDNPLDWTKYIDNNILGMFSYRFNDTKPTRIFNNYEIALDDFNLRFQFGIHNPDYPAAILQRAFILDFDAYFQGLFDPKDISSLLDTYHQSIQDIFEQVITNDLREYLDEQE